MDIVSVSTKITSTAGGAVLAAHGVPGATGAIEVVLREILQVQDEQTKAIKRIDENVERLIDGPWETARLYLEEAAFPNQTADQQRAKLQRASDSLHDAVPKQKAGTLRRAYACIDLAVIEQILGESESPRYYARLAVNAAAEAVVTAEMQVKKQTDKVGNVVSLAGVSVVALLPGLPTIAGMAEATLERLPNGKRAKLRELRREFSRIDEAATRLCRPNDAELTQARRLITPTTSPTV